MIRFTLALLAIVLPLIPCTAFADPPPNLCPEEFSQETETHYYQNVKCDMTLQMFQDQLCYNVAKTFEVKLKGNGLDHKVICDTQTPLLLSLGDNYRCRWSSKNGGSNLKYFNWMKHGKREWTCQHLINWVREAP